MREVRKGNISIPMDVVEKYLEAFRNPDSEGASASALEMHNAIIKAHDEVEQGLNKKSLAVCIGKLGYVDPKDAQRFMSKEIPRLTVYNETKASHSMPLYFKHKPSWYVERMGSPSPKKKAAKG